MCPRVIHVHVFGDVCLSVCRGSEVHLRYGSSGTARLVFLSLTRMIPRDLALSFLVLAYKYSLSSDFLHGAVDQTQNLMLAQRALY